MCTTITGITPTGIPHIGNYIGAIRPAARTRKSKKIYCLIADMHALIKITNPRCIRNFTFSIAATWLALGLNLKKNVILYRQSDLPEILHFMWLLFCVCPKGLMNRAHAYKALVSTNIIEGIEEIDRGIMMGLYGYPILMAADILLFSAKKVFVGWDQIKHLEMIRDIARKFNKRSKANRLSLPNICNVKQVLNGIDGRKMSKLYGNTIPVLSSPEKLRKRIKQLQTNSLEPGVPKYTEGCTLFKIYYSFQKKSHSPYASGRSWLEVKNIVIDYISQKMKNPRGYYYEIVDETGYIEEILQRGVEQARDEAIKIKIK